ncbi:MAG: copper-containing nitrite reductase [Chloroflexota bacterium]
MNREELDLNWTAANGIYAPGGQGTHRKLALSLLTGNVVPAFVLALCILLLSGCADMVSVQASSPATGSHAMLMSDHGATVTYALQTVARDGGLDFVGVGGDIDGQVNPPLQAEVGDLVVVTLTNREPSEHDIAIPDFDAHSDHLHGIGSQTTVQFIATKSGDFPYYCTVSGHRIAGMQGSVIVGGTSSAVTSSTPVAPATSTSASAPAQAPSIARAPDDLPPSVRNRQPQLVRVTLETAEVIGQLADGATYKYMTFNGTVPGPLIRVRVGDTVEVTLKNPAGSAMTHSIDLHAVTGPGGGATITQVAPGEQKTFTFKALAPGLFIYHCASPLIAQHIASGMYGMILVEPEGGLPPVDREFYVMQGELYTQQPFGSQGLLAPSDEKLFDEQPEYFVFNGAVGALTTQHPLQATTGQTVRIFFGVGGPNFTSSFHVVGEMFDKVYNQGSLTSPPLTNVQTTLVPAGGSTVVEMKLEVPGKYMLMDHSLSRADRGLSGYLIVEGGPRPDLFHPGEADK